MKGKKEFALLQHLYDAVGYSLSRLLMGPFEAEEEEDGVKDESRSDATKGVHEKVELRLLETVLCQPFQHLVFGHQIASVNRRETTPEVDHGWELGHAIFTGVTRVADLDKCDVQVVRFGVNVLQLLQHFLAFRTVVFICLHKPKKCDSSDFLYQQNH